MAGNGWNWLEMAFGTFSKLVGPFGLFEDSEKQLLGASLGPPLGVFGVSLQCSGLGYPRLGLDLAELG